MVDVEEEGDEVHEGRWGYHCQFLMDGDGEGEERNIIEFGNGKRTFSPPTIILIPDPYPYPRAFLIPSTFLILCSFLIH